MVPNILHVPNGQTIEVKPVFGGLFFKANDLNVHHAAFAPGWTVIIESEEESEAPVAVEGIQDDEDEFAPKKNVHRYRKPTLHNDNMFLSSISNPSNQDFKPAVSPTRQIAMMLWATLWWYFHQPQPNPHISACHGSHIPEAGRPKGEWRINIKREGIFKGRHLLPKLERMGLISSEDSSVGLDVDDRSGEGWTQMFVSQRAFWQLDPRIFLFTLSPVLNSPFPSSSPYPSRPGSPVREGFREGTGSPRLDSFHLDSSQGLGSPNALGPFASGSHLPTYYPPPAPQYVMSDGVRHPLRPKPPRQGETFYTRYVPSQGQYLSFRVASLSSKAPTHHGPVSSCTPTFLPPNSGVSAGTNLPSVGNMSFAPCDIDLLHKWMNDPRVSAAWGVTGPIETQQSFLKSSLQNKHSYPVIGCWDGKPFGFFEIYWVKEDQLGRYINSDDLDDWDRGFHALVGEQEFRGKERVKVWLSALVHCCWLADSRTKRVLLEPRADNEKFINYLQDVGFHKTKEISFPFKQAALMRMAREAWIAPFL